MMINATTFILAGGRMSKASDSGIGFYQTIIDGFAAPKVLVCAFAQDPEQYEQSFSYYKPKLEEANPGSAICFQSATIDKFIEQINWADVIFFLGGLQSVLVKTLQSVPDWRKCDLSSKTVVGSSAGAYMLSAAFPKTEPELHLASGLGLVPVIVVAHYRPDVEGETDENHWSAVDSLLETVDTELQTILLHEGEYAILTH